MAEKKTTKKALPKKSSTKKPVTKAKKTTSSSKEAPKATPKKKSEKKPETKSKASSGFAVIATGAKQYKVSVGDIVKIEKISGGVEEGSTVTFDTVLLRDNGKETTLGTPHIDKAKVEAEVVKSARDKKVSVVKFKSKSRYFKRRGHRQPYMEVKITKI